MPGATPCYRFVVVGRGQSARNIPVDAVGGAIARWQNGQHRSAPTTLAEDRRLFYVGLTRARYEVHLVYVHDGSTRHRWVADVLEGMLAEPYDGPTHPPEIFCRVIDHLMSPATTSSTSTS